MADVAAPDPTGRRARPARSRRRVVAAATLAGMSVTGVAGAVAVAAAGDTGAGAGAGTGEADGTGVATATATVETRDLVTTESYEGQLGYGDASPIVAGRAGVVTSVAAVGETVAAGGTLFTVDLEPTVLLAGAVPAFRDLSVDSEDGADVAQLEQALVDAEYGDGLTVDEDFTSATAAAVEAWEEALGRTGPDGTVELGDVVFAPEAVRISTISAEVATQVEEGTTVVEATPTAKVVTVDVGVDDAARVEAGTAVTLELPDGSEAAGTIADVDTDTGEADDDAATSGAEGEGDEPTVTVTVSFDDPAAAADFDSGTVDVTVERSRVDGATAVPVTALLALAEGGYAVQVVDDAEPSGHRLVGVEVGTYADGYVEVTGDGIEDGADVVVPA